MDDLLEPSSDDAELRTLRAEFDQLLSVVRLSLWGLLVVTLSMGVLIFRNDTQIYRQMQAQAPVVAEAEKKNAEIIAIVAEFQKFGATHPGYASNVLGRFNLPPLSATGAAPGARK
ncbi:MAG TPA: hypothetical protein VMB21_16450 [Candidatus Limnocylindria bacterium]|nr:hypothetical protein [Candidatus Limnocylindria bacterium]